VIRKLALVLLLLVPLLLLLLLLLLQSIQQPVACSWVTQMSNGA
jgi:hypothetical protein